MLTENMIEKILDEAVTRGADFAEVFEENSLFEETVATQELSLIHIYGIKYMFSGSRSGVEVELWWSHLHARFEKCENSSCVGVQSLSLTDSIQQDVA